jgi:hypothetical protein
VVGGAEDRQVDCFGSLEDEGYDEKFRADLEADAKTKSFARYPYFYTVGMRIGKLYDKKKPFLRVFFYCKHTN